MWDAEGWHLATGDSFDMVWSTLLLAGWADNRSYHKRHDVLKNRDDLIGCSTAYDSNFAPTFSRDFRTNLLLCTQSSSTSSGLWKDACYRMLHTDSHLGKFFRIVIPALEVAYVHNNVKLSLCVPCRCVGGVDVSFLLLNLCTRWRWVVSFLPWSHNPWAVNPGWAKELVWAFLEKRKISSLFQESNPWLSSP